MNAICMTIMGIMAIRVKKRARYYTRISEEKLRELLAKDHDIQAKHRWVRVNLKWLSDNDYLIGYLPGGLVTGGTRGLQRIKRAFTAKGVAFLAAPGTQKINKTCRSLIKIMADDISKHGRDYTEISLEKFRELLAKDHNRHVRYNAVYKNFKRLKDNGYITRRPYLGRNPNLVECQRPLIYTFTVKGAKHLVICGIINGKAILKSISSEGEAFIKSNEAYWARVRQEIEDEDREAIERFKNM